LTCAESAYEKSKHGGNDCGGQPNFFHQAKSCRRIVFGEKNAVQFYQQLKIYISSLNLRTFFCQICLLFVIHCAPNKASDPVLEKKPRAYVDDD